VSRTGRPRKPDALKRLEGNPGHRPLNHDEPKFDAVISCPAWLTVGAKTEWRRICKELKAVPGLLMTTDRAVLASYCQYYAGWHEAEVHLAKFGKTVIINGQHGYCAEQASAWVGISKVCHDDMMKSAREMGFTPAARSGVKVQQPSKPTQDLLTPPKSLPPRKV
jgi:P27 family predicted phage terminase small subunit